MSCPHRIIEVEDFTPLGAHVKCCACGKLFHASETYLDSAFLPFTHTSPDSPELDRCVYIRLDFLDKKDV